MAKRENLRTKFSPDYLSSKPEEQIEQYQEAVRIIMSDGCLCKQMDLKWGKLVCPYCIARNHLKSALYKAGIRIAEEVGSL